jgi:hypothetical protein
VTLSIVVSRAVFSAGPITFHRVAGAILLYLNIGLIFVALFCFVGLLVPNAFVGLGPLQDNLAVAGNLIYFSFVTLTSVGYGDIVPLHPFARGLRGHHRSAIRRRCWRDLSLSNSRAGAASKPPHRLYWPPKPGSDACLTGGGFHFPVSASDRGA